MAQAMQIAFEERKNKFTEIEVKEINKTLKMLLKQANREDYIKVFNEFGSFTQCNMYKVKALLDKKIMKNILEKVDLIDLYHSVNTYKSYTDATETNMSQVLNIVIDVDYRKSFFYRRFTPENFLDHLKTEVYGQVIPCPSATVYTGNNFHIIYYLKKGVPATTKAKSLVKRIQKHLTAELKDYNADKSINLTTMTRFSNSINSKTGNEVLYKFHKKTYFLEDLKECLPDLPEWYEGWNKKKAKNKKKKANIKPLFSYRTDNKKIEDIREYALLRARLQDLEKLQELRGNNCRGKREIMCFLYRNFAIQCMNPEDAETGMYNFNSKFNSPLIEKRIESKTRGVERKAYKYKHKTLIEDVLDITKDEQKYMLTIISKEEVESRQRERNKLQDEQRKADRRNEEGLTKREQDKLDKIKKIKELYEQGLKQKEIAEKLEISTRQVRRLKQIQKADMKCLY